MDILPVEFFWYREDDDGSFLHRWDALSREEFGEIGEVIVVPDDHDDPRIRLGLLDDLEVYGIRIPHLCSNIAIVELIIVFYPGYTVLLSKTHSSRLGPARWTRDDAVRADTYQSQVFCHDLIGIDSSL